MSYAPTKYDDVDLALKATRGPMASGAKPDPVVKYAQTALNDLGSTSNNGKPLNPDGRFGPKTTESVLHFQEASDIPRTGIMNQDFFDQLDWRVFGDINGSWTHFKTSKPSTCAGCRAYIVVKGMAYNRYLQPLTPVNSLGLTREGQRLSDVIEAFAGKALGAEGAVDRNTAGGKVLSRHALGLAGDDMGDQDKDRIVEPDEIAFLKAMWDYLFMRAQGFEAEMFTLRYRLPGAVRDTVTRTAWRGRDRLCTMVLGNLATPAGYIFPTYARRKDTSWTAVRNTPKSLSSTIHVAPFHLHTDCLPGAPYGSPF